MNVNIVATNDVALPAIVQTVIDNKRQSLISYSLQLYKLTSSIKQRVLDSEANKDPDNLSYIHL